MTKSVGTGLSVKASSSGLKRASISRAGQGPTDGRQTSSPLDLTSAANDLATRYTSRWQVSLEEEK